MDSLPLLKAGDNPAAGYGGQRLNWKLLAAFSFSRL
jgi:hypothetical protein